MRKRFDPHAPPPKRNRRRLLVVIGAVALLLIAFVAWPRARSVRAVTVERGDLVVTVSEEGVTRVKNRYVVYAPASGQLRRIDLKAGEPVVAGQTVLAVLETSGVDLLDARSLDQARARARAAASSLERAGAQRARAQANLDLVRLELQRVNKLLAGNAISAQEADSARLREVAATQELRAAEFDVQVAAFEQEQAETQLRRYSSPGPGGKDAESPTMEIVAPVGGRVLRVQEESARAVVRGAALVEVGDPSDLEVVVEVLSRDGVAILPGAPVTLEQWGGPYPLKGRVRLIEPSGFTKVSSLGVEEQRVKVIADLEEPPARRLSLGDGFRVQARIEKWRGEQVLTAPAGAFVQRADGWFAFRIEDGRARLRPVRVGQTDGRRTQVIEGVAPGSVLIEFPPDDLRDGERVRAQDS